MSFEYLFEFKEKQYNKKEFNDTFPLLIKIENTIKNGLMVKYKDEIYKKNIKNIKYDINMYINEGSLFSILTFIKNIKGSYKFGNFTGFNGGYARDLINHGLHHQELNILFFNIFQLSPEDKQKCINYFKKLILDIDKILLNEIGFSEIVSIINVNVSNYKDSLHQLSQLAGIIINEIENDNIAVFSRIIDKGRCKNFLLSNTRSYHKFRDETLNIILSNQNEKLKNNIDFISNEFLKIVNIFYNKEELNQIDEKIQNKIITHIKDEYNNNLNSIIFLLLNDINNIEKTLENMNKLVDVSDTYIKVYIQQHMISRLKNIVDLLKTIENRTVNINILIDDIISFYTVYDTLLMKFISQENARVLSPSISISTNTIDAIKILYNALNKICTEIKLLNNESYCKNISLIDLTSLLIMIIINRKHEIVEKTEEWKLLKEYIKKCIIPNGNVKEWIENYLNEVKSYWKNFLSNEDNEIFEVLSYIVKNLYLDPYAFR